MKQKETDINTLLKKTFSLKQFSLLINLQDIIDELKNGNIRNNIFQDLNEQSYKIALSLDELQITLEAIDNVGKVNGYEYKWLSKGKIELIQIFALIDSLEHHVDVLLTQLEKLTHEKMEALLDDLSSICNSVLLIKKVSHPIKTCLSILTHHSEIEKEVLTSVHNEIMFCIDELEQLNEKKNLLKIEDYLTNFSIKDFLNKKNELNVALSTKYNGFIIFSTLDGQIFDIYTKLHDSILPISESLNIIPLAIESFHDNAKTYYKSLIIDVITNYEVIISKFSEYRKQLKMFKADYVTKRNDLICERIFQIINNNELQESSNFEDILNVLKPIENYYGLSEEHSLKLKSIENKFYNFKLEENIIQTPLPKTKSNQKFKCTFSNPIVDSLNMKPILSENINKKKTDIKIFETPRNIDQNIFSKNNIDIVDRIKIEVMSLISNDKIIPDTPSSENSFSSENSSPETMKTRNIFDSPDPFITPNSRSFHRSKLPISTPLTTPRITPTRKYVMLPIDEEPNQKNNRLPSINGSTKLLQYEFSTVINTGPQSKIDGDTSNLSDLSANSDSFLDSPGQDYPNSPDSPDIQISRIPLPKRPESRLSMLRSSSRLQMSRFEPERLIHVICRPDSRLENLASNISHKLGTNSPALSINIKARSSTVMTHREMTTKEMPIQLGRLRPMASSSNLNNVKTRGVTSLGSRSVFTKSRFTSI